MKQLTKLLLICLPLVLSLYSCKKEWLDAKPNKSLAVPHTLRDYKSLISSTIASPGFNTNYATLPEHGSGDFFFTTAAWGSVPETDRAFYLWKKELWIEKNYAAWEGPYSKILYTNVVLEGIEKIVPVSNAEQIDWNQTKGAALFLRAVWHYEIAKQFCKVYNKTTASGDPGIPLRLNADFNEVSTRSTVEATYSQIIYDLKAAAILLPVERPDNLINKCQPTKTAAYAMLARVYLAMSDYVNALEYADKSLLLYNVTLNYNDSVTTRTNMKTFQVALNPAPTSTLQPFANFNDDMIFHMRGSFFPIFGNSTLSVDTNLYKSYNANDLRKRAFFRLKPDGTASFKGSYEPIGSITFWTGLSTAEVYLIRAECRARKGDLGLAMADLNFLMRRRWKTGTWIDASATDMNDALSKILTERRKELVFRSIRWTDLRRLNKEPQFAVTLTREIPGHYELPANSPLYVFPIPPNVIQLTGMPQNPR